ncbi:hypothetical protein D0T25_17815 [Duganella sp. BJB488]|uniref:hypothetical protein n=1 Tax=unclassified Duganella TaxID=2636909 RepID=UPI000E351BB4|nr:MULTISPECIES: hypothetical protein [unclassified Duganella]RFP16734.1 hypothetical protein D0T26_17715 [Duganella sp. BJB489]RFP20844.1 hypothetical protein D0T25_17815 [Duganella sp. BJB488]RFP32095.1 hypothetical protein D0T24_21090 [Duganella sp. BJB480]
MDQHKLRSLVFEKTGVRIDIDDPVFALVALNEAVLAETVERHVALIDAASQELAQQARLAGGLAAQPGGVRKPVVLDATNEPAGADAPSAYAPAPASGPVRPIATQAAAITPRELRLLGAAAGVAVLSALLVLGGQAAFFKPGLTAEQSAALVQADKLNKAIQKLDPKVREQLQAELQK